MDNETKNDSTFLHPEQVLKQAGLVSGKKVADLGCGGGYFLLAAARLVGDKGEAYGVDVLKTALSSIASKARLFNLQNIHLVWSDVEIYGGAKAIHNNSLDMVLLVQLLSQVQKKSEVFREVDRIMKKDGTLVVVDWNNNNLSFGPDAKKHIPEAEVKELAGQSGFRFNRAIQASPYHYGLIFNKAK